MEYNILDAIMVAVILISTVLAYSRGFVRESLSLLGWVIALIVAAQFAHLVVPYIQNLPFIRDYIADSCELLTMVGFVILFIIMIVIMSLITPLFSDFVKNSALGLLDRMLGAIFGFVRGLLIVLLVFVVYDAFIAPSTRIEMVDQSRTFEMFANPRDNLKSSLPSQEEAPNWIFLQFEKITSHCTGETPNA